MPLLPLPVLVHRALYDGTPEYLAALLLQHAPRRSLRSAGGLGPCIYRFFLFRFQICERKTDNEFLFRFSFSNLRTKNEKPIPFSFFVFKSEVRKTKNEFVFKSEVRKTKNEFVFAFRMLRSHCHFGWPVKLVVSAENLGRTGNVLKTNSQKLHRRIGTYIYMYLQVNIGHFGAVFYVSTIL